MSAPTFNNVCPYWEIVFDECCRGSGAQNIMNAGATNSYITAALNIYYKQNTSNSNNSPELRNEASIAVCGGQEVMYNMGAVDADGDSLTYALAPQRVSGGGLVSTAALYGHRYPFPLNSNSPPHSNFPQTSDGPKVILDPITGDIGFNPLNNNPNSSLSGYLTIEIIQWGYDENKNAFIVGKTMREVETFVNVCSGGNSPPSFSTSPALPNGSARYNWSVCAGDQICFTITGKDADDGPGPQPPTKLDTTYLSWNNGIVRPGKLTFVPDYNPNTRPRPVREDRWKFCWQTEESDGSTQPYSFTATTVDNSCPNIGMATKSFNIYVTPSPEVTATKTSLGCNQWKYEVKKTNPLQVFTNAKLEIAKEPNDANFNAGSFVTISTNPNPAASGGNAATPRTIISTNTAFTKPGIYYIKYSAFIPGIEPGQSCSKIIFDSIVVDTSVLQITAQDAFACKFNSVSINAVASGGQAPYAYKWYKNNLSSAPINGPGYIASDTSSTPYIVQVTDLRNCTSQKTIMVNVSPLPQAPFSSNTANICLGKSYTFNAGSNGGNVREYQWVKNNTVLPNDTLQQLQSSEPGTYVAVITDTLGCTQKDTLVLQVLPQPTVEAGNSIMVCKNAPAFLISNQSGATSNSTIAGSTYWQAASGQLPNISNAIVGGQSFEPANNIIPASGGTWKLYYKDTASGCLSLDSINITVKPLPMVTLIAAKDTVCSTDVSLQLNGIPANGVFSGNAISNSGLFNIQNPAVLPNANYTFTYRFSDVFGCADSALKTIFVLRTPALLAITGNVNPIKNTSQSYSVSLVPNQSYVWLANKGVVQSSSLNTASVLWTDTGAAWVKVVTSNACGTATSEQNIQVAPTVGLNEANGLSNVTLYPNPTFGEVFVTGNTAEQQVQIEVFNNTLQLVYSQSVKAVQGKISTHFTTETLSNGLYFVRIGNGKKHGVYKLVVMR
jgi:hypothetical protein